MLPMHAPFHAPTPAGQVNESSNRYATIPSGLSGSRMYILEKLLEDLALFWVSSYDQRECMEEAS